MAVKNQWPTDHPPGKPRAVYKYYIRRREVMALIWCYTHKGHNRCTAHAASSKQYCLSWRVVLVIVFQITSIISFICGRSSHQCVPIFGKCIVCWRQQEVILPTFYFILCTQKNNAAHFLVLVCVCVCVGGDTACHCWLAWEVSPCNDECSFQRIWQELEHWLFLGDESKIFRALQDDNLHWALRSGVSEK